MVNISFENLFVLWALRSLVIGRLIYPARYLKENRLVTQRQRYEHRVYSGKNWKTHVVLNLNSIEVIRVSYSRGHLIEAVQYWLPYGDYYFYYYRCYQRRIIDTILGYCFLPPTFWLLFRSGSDTMEVTGREEYSRCSSSKIGFRVSEEDN